MRRLPLATIGLAVVLVAVFAVELSSGVEGFALAHGFDPSAPSFTGALGSLALHASVGHLVGNVAVLLVVGALVEAELGGLATLVLFLSSGLAGCVTHMFVAPGSDVLVGCSGSLCGLMAVAAVARPRFALAFVVAFVGMNVLGLLGVSGLVPAGTSLACHVGGFVCGAAVVFVRAARFGRLSAA